MDVITEQNKVVSGIETFKNMKPEQKEGLKTFTINAIISAIVVLILGSIFYFRYDTLLKLSPDEVAELQAIGAGLSGWGITCLIFAAIFYLVGIFTFLHYRKKYKAGEITKDVSKVIFRILVCSVCAWFASSTLMSFDDIWYSVYVYVLAFACSWMFFQLFSSMKYKTFKRVLWFPLALVFRFFIPMTLVCILFLGVMNGLFPHEPIFLDGIKQTFGTDTYVAIPDGGSLGGIFAYGCYKVVSSIYLLGESRPQFMLILCILLTVFLLYRTIKKHFVDGVPPMSFIDTVTEKELLEWDATETAQMEKTSEQIKAELAAKEKVEEEADAKEEENFKVKLY
jgi:hypothetical protein